MRTGDLLVLTREDLITISENKKINDINSFDIKGTFQPFASASLVIFVDDNGSTRILKNRYGKIGDVVQKKEEPNIEELKKTYFKGQEPLWQEGHREESERLRKVLISKGFTNCSIGEAEGVWMQYSDSYAAGFLGMPEDDEDIFDCVKHLLYVSTFIKLCP